MYRCINVDGGGFDHVGECMSVFTHQKFFILLKEDNR